MGHLMLERNLETNNIAALFALDIPNDKDSVAVDPDETEK